VVEACRGLQDGQLIGCATLRFAQGRAKRRGRTSHTHRARASAGQSVDGIAEADVLGVHNERDDIAADTTSVAPPGLRVGSVESKINQQLSRSWCVGKP
jgi:hypothetical protein